MLCVVLRGGRETREDYGCGDLSTCLIETQEGKHVGKPASIIIRPPRHRIASPGPRREAHQNRRERESACVCLSCGLPCWQSG